MKLHEELYFEITAEADRETVDKFVAFVTSGELDDFFEFTSDYIIYSDNYNSASYGENVSVTLANDDYGIEIDSFNPEDFLDALCSGGKNLFIHGNLYDIDNEEYRFVSHVGDTSYDNSDDIEFTDELDDEARREESLADDDYE